MREDRDKAYVAFANIALREINNLDRNDKIAGTRLAGTFLVKPIVEGFFKKRIIGYTELITGAQIINRNDSFSTKTEHIVLFSDPSRPEEEQQRLKYGEVCWEVLEAKSADQLLPQEEYFKYLTQTEVQIRKQLRMIKELSAKKIEDNKLKLERKKQLQNKK